MINRIPAMVLSFAFVLNTVGQKPLPKKPYQQWSLREVAIVLTDSPWAQMMIDSGHTTGNVPGDTYIVELRLYSALPIRQAIVREMQLTIPYDKLKSDLKTSYDAEVEGLLTCSQCATHYIVTFFSPKRNPLEIVSGKDPLPPGYLREGSVFDVVAFLKRTPRDELLRRVWLSNDKGERRSATSLAFSNRNEIVFLFPRFDDQGKPLITTSNKKFYFEVDRDLFSKKAKSLKKFTFDVSRIIQDGAVVF